MNNKPLTDSVRATLRDVELTPEEKAALLFSLHAEMERSPILEKSSTGGVRMDDPKRHLSHNNIIMKIQKRKFIPVVVLASLLVGGTVSYAAERTLPGDVLYPVKIHVNERVRTSLAVSAKAKAEISATLAERRLDEAAALQSEGRLDAEARTELRQRFDDHEERAEDNIKIIARTDAGEAARIESDLRLRIKEHSSILGALEINLNNEDESGDDDMRNNENENGDLRARATTSISTSASHSGDDDRRGEDRKDESRDSDDDSGLLDIRINSSTSINDTDDERDNDEDDDDYRDQGDAQRTPTPPPPTPKTDPAPTPVITVKTFTLAQVAIHNNAISCYTTINGSVYDITSYIPHHPGGVAAISAVCGKDGTSMFQGQHSGNPKPENILASFKIGILAQ